MPTAAGNVQVVLNVNSTTYTKAMQEAQRELDKFAGKSKQAGHATVSSMQASSAALRELNGDFTNNIRAVERFITTVPGVGNALKAAFPIVGGVAFGAMLFELGSKVKEFIDKANAMPKAIQRGFESLHLSAMSSVDALKLTNDQLQNHINKLQGKSKNNLAIQLDEARIKADDLAKSLEEDAKRVDALLSQNKITGLMTLLTGKGSTATIAGSVQYGLQEIQHLAYLNRQAVGTPVAAQAAKNLADKQAYYQQWARNNLFLVDHPEYQTNESGYFTGDQTGNRNILLGFQDVLNDQQGLQSERDRNGRLVEQNQAAEAAKAAAEVAKKAAEEQARQFRESLEVDEQLLRVNQELVRKMDEFRTGYLNDFYKSQGLSSDDNKQLDHAGKSTASWITALHESIELQQIESSNLNQALAQLGVATGGMSKLDAAQFLANLHEQDYNNQIQSLMEQRASIKTDHRYDQDETGRKAALQENENQASKLVASHTIQSWIDQESTNPLASSGGVGFKNALDDFVIASRDAATQMRDLTTNILGGLNQQVVAGMSGQNTSFGSFGAGIFRSIANLGLTHIEGSALEAFGFGNAGKIGTQSNPMYVRFADAVSGAAGSVGGFLSKLFGGSKGSGQSGLDSVLSSASQAYSDDQAGGGIGTIASVLTDTIPFLASGGPINGPAIVGELGPELWVPPTSGGTIIPNHKLSMGGGDTHYYYMDARGAHDPAAFEAAAERVFAKHRPGILAQSIAANIDYGKRRPSAAR